MNNIGKLCIQCGEKTTLGAWRCPACVSSSDRRLWLDLETSGLDPHKDSILEVFAAAEDPMFPFSFPASSLVADTVVEQPLLDISTWPEKLVAIHETNGLLRELRNPLRTMTLAQVEEVMLTRLNEHDRRGKTFVLAGFSPHFDLSFLRVHMPRVAERLSHRVFDVSTLRAFVKDLDVAFDKPSPGCRHRAEDDTEAAMRTAFRIAHAILREPDELVTLRGLIHAEIGPAQGTAAEKLHMLLAARRLVERKGVGNYEIGAPCTHNWTVTSPCPKCLESVIAQKDRTIAALESSLQEAGRMLDEEKGLRHQKDKTIEALESSLNEQRSIYDEEKGLRKRALRALRKPHSATCDVYAFDPEVQLGSGKPCSCGRESGQ